MGIAYSQYGTIVRSTTISTDVSRTNTATGITIVDKNGNIGSDISYLIDDSEFANTAIVVDPADYSDSGLGKVDFLIEDSVIIGGKSYKTVNIGGKIWLAENLYLEFEGLDIGPSTTPTSTPAAWYYSDDLNTYGPNGPIPVGFLYNHYAVEYIETNKNTLLPSGWRVPTKTDFENLRDAVGGSSSYYAISKYLKSKNATWASSSYNGIDSYSFNGFPGGYRSDSGSYNNITIGLNLWTITDSGSQSYSIWLDTTDYYHIITNDKKLGLNLRLVKDIV